MRGLGRLVPVSAHRTTAATQSLPSSSSSYAYSTFSGGGRGRGRGSSPPPKPPPAPRVPGQTDPDAEDGDAFLPSLGAGRGRGSAPVLPSSPVLPSFSSWLATGRGRGQPPTPPTSGTQEPRAPFQPTPDSLESHTKEPFFFRREDPDDLSKKTQFADPDETAPLPAAISPRLPGAGRGKPTKSTDSDISQENRHLRPRPPIGRRPEPTDKRGLPSPSNLSQEERVRKAVEVLSRPGERGERGRGRGFGGRRGRGRGGFIRGRGGDAADEFALYLGDNADGEKLKAKLGEATMSKLEEGFEELSWDVLPSPLEDAYLDALHTNNMIEYEPEYLMEFDRNPDIDEKPPMSLRDALEKAKPFLMAYEGIQSQEEWEEIIKETMEKVPYMKELIDMYCGPDRVTAKQQQQELERVAKTLPEDVPSSVKRFTDRAVLSLQSNPGWGFDKKCQFMDKLVWEVSQHYK